MGTEYRVACRDCRVSRELDKFYAMRKAEDRKEALQIADEIQREGGFRAALLASFMWEHKGHNCTVFNEHDDELSEELDPFFGNDVKEDREFWIPSKDEN